jgi:predicted nucleic acid-binding protein
MIAVDTNVLVYAHREELRQHRSARSKLIALAESDTPWSIPVFCIGEFVRVVTHPKVFDPPYPL